jgi:hypothetical protein
MIRNRLLKFFIIGILFSPGCDKGISPEPEGAQAAGFSGTVFFSGAWPDSITRTHLVVFKDPLDSVSDFNPFNLRFVSLEIPYGSTIFNYNSIDSSSFSSIAAGNYSYIAVAQSKTPELSLNRIDWFVAGVYYSDNDTAKPGILIIPENTLITGINILVDFNNPPPQPPGGN